MALSQAWHALTQQIKKESPTMNSFSRSYVTAFFSIGLYMFHFLGSELLQKQN